MIIPRSKRPTGLTLLELLCVIGIITILAALLLGPVHKAYARVKAMEWEMKVQTFAGRIADQLRDYCLSRTNYPALSVQELSQLGVFDIQMTHFLTSNKDKVEYFPFSSSDPNGKVILRWQYGRHEFGAITKKEVVPESESNRPL